MRPTSDTQAALVVDGEFRSLCPPLASDEKALLEESIRREGCREALIAWGNVVVDGHNRLDICTRLGIEYRVDSREFGNRDAVRLWIINNQLGRRNLQPIDKVPLLRAREEIVRRQAKARQSAGAAATNQRLGRKSETVVEISPEPKGTTRDKLGAEIGVSGKTYEDLRKVSECGVPELVQAVREKQVSAEGGARLAVKSKDEQREILAAGKDAVRAATRRPKPKSSAPVLGPPRDGMQFARMAVMDLEKIRDDDAERKEAFDYVKGWIAHHEG